MAGVALCRTITSSFARKDLLVSFGTEILLFRAEEVNSRVVFSSCSGTGEPNSDALSVLQ